jgi:hypothetical protein
MLRFRSAPSADDEYTDSLTAWQTEHDANDHDFTREQAERFRIHNRLTNAGIDPSRATYWRHLVEKGRVQP